MAVAGHSMDGGETTSSISPVGNLTYRCSKASFSVVRVCEREREKV